MACGIYCAILRTLGLYPSGRDEDRLLREGKEERSCGRGEATKIATVISSSVTSSAGVAEEGQDQNEAGDDKRRRTAGGERRDTPRFCWQWRLLAAVSEPTTGNGQSTMNFEQNTCPLTVSRDEQFKLCPNCRTTVFRHQEMCKLPVIINVPVILICNCNGVTPIQVQLARSVILSIT